MDELRVEIWDYLYRAPGPQSLDDIARGTERDPETVRTAVNDDSWFDVADDLVSIAYEK